MKKIFLLLLLIFSVNVVAQAGVTVEQNKEGKWDTYYTATNGQRFLIYTQDLQSSPVLGAGDMFYQTKNNLFYIVYRCLDYDDSCIRFIDLTTNQMSPEIYHPVVMQDNQGAPTGIIINLAQKVILTFDYKADNDYTVTPIFQKCKKPLTYETPSLGDGPDPGTKFLDNGDVYIKEGSLYGTNMDATIKIDYEQLYKHCNE